MSVILSIIGLIGAGSVFGLVGGYLLGRMERMPYDDEQEHSCVNCKYGDLEWDEEPCYECPDHCGWEAMDD